MERSPLPDRVSEDRKAAVAAVVDDFLRRMAAGEDLHPQDAIAQHGELMPELGRELPKAHRIALARRQAPAASLARTVDFRNSQLDETTPPDRPLPVGSRSRSPEFPETFGRYRIVKLLGQGGMGAVYLAEDTELKRKVALKAPKFDEGDGPEVLERFYREARLAATLRHPHICPVYDIGQIDGVFYISMAYIEGKPLSAYVHAEKPQSERSCATVVRKLALALAEAHAQGVIHRDLKPSNVMIDKKGEPVVMDFGLARHASGSDDTHRLTQTGAIVGSPSYMSPEQVLNASQLGPTADVYSLGVMLFELLTGKLPFGGSLSALIGQILTHDPPPPSEHRPGLDSELEAICLRMLAKRPEERYPSMTAVAEALTEFLKKTAPSGVELAAPSEDAAQAAVEGSLLSTANLPPALPPPVLVALPALPVALGPYATAQPPTGETATTRREPSLAEPGAILATAPETDGYLRRRGKRTGARPAKAAPAAERVRFRWRPPLWVGVAAVGLAAVAILLGAILTLTTKDGVLTVKVMEPDVQIEIDGEAKIVIGSQKVGRIELRPGPHRLVVKRGEEELYTDSFTLKSGGEVVLEANWQPTPRPSPASPAPAAPVATAWATLFNGRDLTGWRPGGGQGQPWQVKDGALDNSNAGAARYLATEQEFSDFELELQYRLAPGGNSGVYFRAPADQDLGVAYLEVQLLDTGLPLPTTGVRTGLNGALYGLVAPSQTPPAPADQWNLLALRAEGDHITVRIQGVLVVDADLSDLRARFPNMPGLASSRGHLLLQRHTGAAAFRNLRIRELSPSLGAAAARAERDDQEADGFVPLVDGKSLAGSQASVGPSDLNAIPRGVWIPVMDELIALARDNPNVAVADGVLEMKKPFALLLLPFRAKDVAVRAQVKPDADVNACLGLRHQDGKNYTAFRRQYGEASIGKADPDFSFLKVAQTKPFRNDEFEEFAFSAIGDTLTIEVNGRRVNEVTDAALRDAGQVGIGTIYGTAWFKDVEVKILDPPLPKAPSGAAENTSSLPLMPSTRWQAADRHGTRRPAETFQDHAYRFFTEQVTWREAKTRCEALGGHLAVIDSAAENAFVAGLVAAAGWQDCWIGATDEAQEGRWLTVAGAPLAFTNWFPGQPNNKPPGEHYALMSNRVAGASIDWRWSDQPNESKQHTPGFVCEWE